MGKEALHVDKKLLKQLKSKLDSLFMGEFVDYFNVEDFLSLEFCEVNLGLNQPLLIKPQDVDGNEAKRYIAISISKELYYINTPCLDYDTINKVLAWITSSLEDLKDIYTSQIERKVYLVKVYVAYSWFKGADVLKDPFWTSIRDLIIPIQKRINKNFGEDKIAIALSRLRSSHGNFIHKQIFDRIKAADLIIFDLAQSPTLDEIKELNKNMVEDFKANNSSECNIEYAGFNSNVLYELGLAIGMGKETLVLCPKNLKDKIPSDLSNYMFTFYETKLKNLKNNENKIHENITRHFEDNRGLKVYLNNKLNSLAKNFKTQIEKR